jgi:hypothetical protein
MMTLSMGVATYELSTFIATVVMPVATVVMPIATVVMPVATDFFKKWSLEQIHPFDPDLI